VRPFLIEWPFELSSFFSLEILAFIIGITLGVKEAKRVGIDPVKILDMSIVIFIFSLLGAKFFHVLFDGHLNDYINMCVAPFEVDNMAKYFPGGCKSDAVCAAKNLGNVCNVANGKCYEQSCTAAFELWRGGFVYYGGLFGGFVSAMIFISRKKMNHLKIADISAPILALGLGIGRIGCFLAGCCFGSHTDSFLGIPFPSGSPAFKKHLEIYPELMHNHTESLAVFPTQLFSAGAHFLVFLYLFFHLRKKKKYDGEVFIKFLIFYSIFRFIIEFFRADDRGNFLFFTTSQWISIILIAITVFVASKIKNKKKKEDNV